MFACYVRVTQRRVTWLIEHSARINLPQARGVFEALARKRAEGVVLGRPKGRKSSKTKLTGQELKIKELLDKKISYSAIARILGVHRLTVSKFAKERLVQNNL